MAITRNNPTKQVNLVIRSKKFIISCLIKNNIFISIIIKLFILMIIMFL